MTRIIDCNNWVRRFLEKDRSGVSALRGIFNEFLTGSDTPVLVWDGPNSLRSRREHYPEYKEGRQKASKDMYLNFDAVREVLVHTPVVQIRVPGFEADDVIAAIAQPGDTIVSTDRDFLQIEGVACTATPLLGVPPHLVRTFKTMVGDPSDNIPGIKGFGFKSWIEGDQAAYHEWLMAVIEEWELPEIVFPKRCRVDLEALRIYWKIVGFIPVPVDLITANIVVGRKDYAKGDALLKKYMN